MDARTALLDLYQEHLLPRGGQAPVAALVRLLAPLGISTPAVRTAVSRMRRQGLLAPVRVEGVPGYALTEQARMALGRPPDPDDWDGTWHVLLISLPAGRAVRERLHTGLRTLGYGCLGESARTASWIGARASAQLDAFLAATGARAERFVARHDGDSQALIARAWDMEALSRAYRRFLDAPPAPVAGGARDAAGAGGIEADRDSYVQLSVLLRRWAELAALEPGLPAALLPPDWPGRKARASYQAERARLAGPAARFVRSCLPHRGDRP